MPFSVLFAFLHMSPAKNWFTQNGNDLLYGEQIIRKKNFLISKV